MTKRKLRKMVVGKKITLALIALVLTVAGTLSAYIDQGCYQSGNCTYCHFIWFDSNGNVIDSSFWSYGHGCGVQG